MEWLAEQEPEIVFDSTKLRTGADWIAARGMVFDAPIGHDATFKRSQVRDRAWYERDQDRRALIAFL